MAKNETNIVKVVKQEGHWAWTLFAAYIGAVVYFYQQDPGFWQFFWALIKAAVWPAFVIYEVLGALGVK
jgi:hypothetical protein